MPPIKNAKGQFYPWAIEGKNFELHEVGMKYASFLAPYADFVGKQDKVNNDYFKVRMMVDENDLFLNEVKQGKFVGGYEKDIYTGGIKINGLHQGYMLYYKPEQEPAGLDCYEKTKEIAGEVSEHLRNKYVGKTDKRSLHMQERANELADWIDQQTKMYDPKAGSIAEAEMHAPYLNKLNALSSGSPKFGSEGIDACVDLLEQKDIPGGTSIYDDYMTMMTAGCRETLLQFDRQKMEATGWDAEKEAEYLKRLRYEHQKTVDAYDRLWAVDDQGQYDSVLNSDLDEMVGKNPNEHRDANHSVGYMRGEIRAIDLGYDSAHLFALGLLGAQEQDLKRMESQLRIGLETENNPEKRKELEEKQKRLQDYKKDFDEFKAGIWNKRVNSREEMEAAGKQVDDFFAAHQEKYADIQDILKVYDVPKDYLKEIAEKAPVIERPQKRMHTKDTDPLSNAAINATIDGFDPKGASKYTEIANHFRKDGTGFIDQKSAERVKAYAAELAGLHDKKIEELEKETKFPNAHAYHKLKMLTVRRKLDNLAQEVPSGPEMTDRSFSSFSGLRINESNDIFEPQNLEKTDKAVAELGLLEFGQKALKLQEMHQSFELNKDIMSPADRRKAYAQILAAKKDMIKLSEKMDQKLENPSEEVKYLFVKQEQIDDIRGPRCLKGLMEQYSADIMKVDLPQADKMSATLGKFNTSRAFVFKEESDEHKEMRLAAETVQKDMALLQSGIVKDSQTGEKRAMTQEEKEKAMQEAWKHVNTLQKKTDAYIAHATKNGTKTPNTPAGEARLAGAMEMKDLMAQYKEQLSVQPELQATAAREKIYEQREAKYGEGVAKLLGSMDKEVEKFQRMSQVEFHDSTAASMAYDLNEWELQAARVIAIATVTEGLEKGQLKDENLRTEVIQGTKDVAGNKKFQTWIKDLSEHPEKMKELGSKSPKEVKEAFVNSLSKDLEKKGEPKKSGPKVDDKKHDKNKEDPQIKEPV